MKKKLLICIMILISFGAFAQKTIENPAYEVSKTGLFNITKIELTDTETKVYINNTFLPNWWVTYKADTYLKDCDTGKKYTITKVEGVDFDEKQWMPDSGETNTIVIFSPLDKGVKKIDYNNTIFGISLSKQQEEKKENEVPKKVQKWFKKELSKVKTTPLKDFNSPDFFNQKPAKLIGYIKGYDTRLGFKTGIMYMSNNITREDYPIVVEIYEDGRFEAELPLIHPEYTYVSLNKAVFSIYIEPEQTLAMVLDWEEFLIADRFKNDRHQFKDITFYGPLSQVNYDLLAYDKNDFDYKTFSNQKKTITPKEFSKVQTRTHKNNSIRLLKHLTTHQVSDKAATILRNKNALENANHLFNFVMNRDYYAKQDTLNKVLKVPVPTNYYDFLQDMDLNNQSLLVNRDFSEFINRFEYCEAFKTGPLYSISKYRKTFLEYITDNNIQIDEAYKNLLTSHNELDGENKINFFKKHKETFNVFQKKYEQEYKQYRHSEILYDSVKIKHWKQKDSILKNTLQLENNLVYETAKIRGLKFEFGRLKKEHAVQYWNELQENITSPFLKQEGDRMFNKAFPSSDNTNVTTKLPKGTATDVFNKIIAPHKGKILFVDFWATSCGPCVGGIKRMKETREKYKDNPDFDFVFITDERGSPQKTYDKFVKEQDLKNIYRLPTDDYNYLRQLFKFNGIPRYVVIDKKGDVIDGDFPMYNFDRLLNDIITTHK
ncbi:TlpA disulfide reductase family protein [Wenyingzhuangia sp. chi5]|uniref:TlpA disulfide reductase family protein n=1 Tax=Wenyingzhuangia gilva TaxID=3057677 RepID=A0ABT8VT04_9FLAO|nr:TlpA disulfide reductase family protein [Wenyingzhuangia sp. chi5]MDO3695072.1 TlpA disulfide reductase family protein [Wenyingzhuangia sp. chi5]